MSRPKTTTKRPVTIWKDKIWVPSKLPAVLGGMPYFSLVTNRRNPGGRVGAKVTMFQDEYYAYAEGFNAWPLEKSHCLVLQAKEYVDGAYQLDLVGVDRVGRENLKAAHSIKHFMEFQIGGLKHRGAFKFLLKYDVSRALRTSLRNTFDSLTSTNYPSMATLLTFLLNQDVGPLKTITPSFLEVILVRLVKISD